MESCIRARCIPRHAFPLADPRPSARGPGEHPCPAPWRTPCPSRSALSSVVGRHRGTPGKGTLGPRRSSPFRASTGYLHEGGQPSAQTGEHSCKPDMPVTAGDPGREQLSSAMRDEPSATLSGHGCGVREGHARSSGERGEPGAELRQQQRATIRQSRPSISRGSPVELGIVDASLCGDRRMDRRRGVHDEEAFRLRNDRDRCSLLRAVGERS